MTDLPAARSTATPHRHKYGYGIVHVMDGGLYHLDQTHDKPTVLPCVPGRVCRVCLKAIPLSRSRTGRTVRNYGNRAELEAARRYGGTKVGHHGGKVDIRGVDFATQMKTHRRKPPVEWKTAIGAMADETRCPRLLIRFVQPTGPEDYFVFRASDFLAWFGKDGETA